MDTNLIVNNKMALINSMKVLIYREDKTILNNLVFEDDSVFLEPLLFAYFNSGKNRLIPSAILKELLQGYYNNKKKIKINYSYNENEIAYIPKRGYFIKGSDTPFSPIIMIKNSKIEVLRYPIQLLQNIFKLASKNKINNKNIIMDDILFNKNINFLTNAFRFIKESSSEHFNLIEQCCKKCIMFNTDPINTNSFATINAHGIAFFNVYQEEYDEVFFIDDIAHQTGHIILTTLFYDKEAIFKIDETLEIELVIKKKDHRTINVLFHALYTYYTSFMCLDNCLENNFFDEKQKKETIGRIGFYLEKCAIDIKNFEDVIKYFNCLEDTLTVDGISIYLTIKSKYQEILTKWNNIITSFNYSNQTYNFNCKNFFKLN